MSLDNCCAEQLLHKTCRDESPTNTCLTYWHAANARALLRKSGQLLSLQVKVILCCDWSRVPHQVVLPVLP